jgi:hypothetical protein
MGPGPSFGTAPTPPSGPRRRRGLWIVGVVAVLATAVAALGIWGVVKGPGVDSTSPPQQASYTVGGCVRIAAQPSVIRSAPNGNVLRAPAQYAAVKCDDKTAHAKIMKMAGSAGLDPSGAAADDSGCAEDTDAIAAIGAQSACLRNLKAPHPGDRGQGGGLVRTGDCVQVLDNYINNVREAACTAKDLTVDGVSFGKEWFGQIAARADTPRGCSAPAIYTVRTKSKGRPVLCIAKNGGWLPAKGDCVDLNSPLNRRKCTDRLQAFKIVALVPAARACPAGARPRGLRLHPSGLRQARILIAACDGFGACSLTHRVSWGDPLDDRPPDACASSAARGRNGIECGS